MFRYLLARMREPATYASAAAVLGTVGVTAPPGVVQNVTLVGTGVAGLLGILLPEGKSAAE